MACSMFVMRVSFSEASNVPSHSWSMVHSGRTLSCDAGKGRMPRLGHISVESTLSSVVIYPSESHVNRMKC